MMLTEKITLNIFFDLLTEMVLPLKFSAIQHDPGQSASLLFWAFAKNTACTSALTGQSSGIGIAVALCAQ